MATNMNRVKTTSDLELKDRLVAVNRVGKDPSCDYSGGSAVIDPYGHTLAACEDGKEGWAEARIDMDALEAFRKKFPVLEDADGFELEIR